MPRDGSTALRGQGTVGEAFEARPRTDVRRRAGRPASELRDALGAAGSSVSTPIRNARWKRPGRARRSSRTGTASGKVPCFQLPTLETLIADPHARALYLYPTKALGSGSGPRLHPGRATPPEGDPPAPSTTATRHARAHADPPRSNPRSSRTRTCSTSACCPITPAGVSCSRTSRSSSSTRRTSTAACSAATSRTSCAACAASPRRTAPRRGSCSRARRSPTRSSWPSGSPARRRAARGRGRLARSAAPDRDVEPARRGRGAADAPQRPGGGRRARRAPGS